MRRREAVPLSIVLILALSSAVVMAGGASSSPQTPLWKSLGPQSIQEYGPSSLLYGYSTAGKVQALAVYGANPLIMYAGGGAGPGNSGPYSSAGALKSTDGGNTWHPIGKGLGDQVVDSLWLDQSNPSKVLASTYFDGIYYTTDGGQAWNSVYAHPTTNFAALGSKLFAASANGVVQSTNDTYWSSNMTSNNPVRVVAAGDGAVYAGLDNGTVRALLPGTGAWKTVLSSPGKTVWSIAVNSSNPDIAYVVEWNNYQSNDIQVTHDGGATWNALAVTGANQYVALDPNRPGEIYAGGDGFLYSSSNGGSTFQQLSLGGDTRLVEPLSSGLYVGSDQGLFLSTDGGALFTSINGNLTNSLHTSLAVGGNTIILATQDHSPVESFDAGTSWYELYGASPPTGEVGESAFNPMNPKYAYVYTTGGFQRSTDGGHTFASVSNLPSAQFTHAGTNQIFGFNPFASNEMYVVAKSAIFRSADWGATFNPLSWPFTSQSMIAFDPSTAQRIFVGDANGLHYSADNGTTWTSSNLGGASGYPIALAFDPANSNVVFAATQNGPEQGGGVLRSIDGGKTFAHVNTGIVTQPAGLSPYQWDLKFDPTGKIIALATTHGLYVSADLGNSWISLQSNAQATEFTGIDWTSVSLYVSTYGQGALSMATASIIAYLNALTTTTTSSTTSSTTTTSNSTTTTTNSTTTSITTTTNSTTSATTSTTTSSATTSISTTSSSTSTSSTSTTVSESSTTSSTSRSSSTQTSVSSSSSATSTSSTTSTSLSSSTTRPTSSTPTTSETAANTSGQTSSGGGGIPEFPFQSVAVGGLSALVAAAYLLARRWATKPIAM